MVRTGATFADAAAEWLRIVEQDRERKPSTPDGLPLDRQRPSAPGVRLDGPGGRDAADVQDRRLTVGGRSNRSKNKALIVLHGIRTA
jgi:hypothetical protein